MKRITALLMFVIFTLLFFNACSDSGKDAETTVNPSEAANDYIGEGFKQTLSLLVEANRKFVEEVFIERTLTVDEKNPKKDGLTTYYPVIESGFQSYSALVNTVNATYTQEIADGLLKNSGYKEIDGKLYCKNKHILKHEDAETPEIRIEGVSVTSEKCVFITFSENGDKIEMIAVYDDGTWKLDKVYTEI